MQTESWNPIDDSIVKPLFDAISTYSNTIKSVKEKGEHLRNDIKTLKEEKSNLENEKTKRLDRLRLLKGSVKILARHHRRTL